MVPALDLGLGRECACGLPPPHYFVSLTMYEVHAGLIDLEELLYVTPLRLIGKTLVTSTRVI